MKLAVVDIGSNTTILTVVEVAKTFVAATKDTGINNGATKNFKILLDEIYFTRLGEGISQTKNFSKVSLERLEKCFSSIRFSLDKLQIEKVFLVATSASRQAQNQQKLFDLAKKYKLTSLEIISPQKEAELTFLGAQFNLPVVFKNPLVVDIGGGSTEIASHSHKYSLKMGSVSLTENFLNDQPLSLQQKSKLNNFVQKEIDNYTDFFTSRFDAIIFTAGTPVSLAFLEKQSAQVHGLLFKQDRLDFWLHQLCQLSLQEKKKLEHLPAYRSDVIVAGLLLLKQILKATEKTQFIVSETGLRYGFILKLLQDSASTDLKH